MKNDKKKASAPIYISIALLFLVLVAGGILLFTYWPGQENGNGFTSSPEGKGIAYKDLVVMENIKQNQIIKSPLLVTGKARGTWFFEGDFPIKLLDESGEVLAIVPAQAQGEWMTEDFVSFEAILEFDIPAANTGFLVLEKNNPSGLPEHADEFQIPIRFKIIEDALEEESSGEEINYTAEEMSKEIAFNFITTKALTYVFDGENLEFVESRAMDLVDCEQCYEFEFAFESRQAGYGDRTGEILAQVITPHTIAINVENGQLTKAITDEKYDEINEEFLE
jgi:hypothetical protein